MPPSLGLNKPSMPQAVFCLHFEPDNGGHTFLWNISTSTSLWGIWSYGLQCHVVQKLLSPSPASAVSCMAHSTLKMKTIRSEKGSLNYNPEDRTLLHPHHQNLKSNILPNFMVSPWLNVLSTKPKLWSATCSWKWLVTLVKWTFLNDMQYWSCLWFI
jgi:hypothetical protein